MDFTNNKHFCILPWIHMHIWPNGTTYPCCLADLDYTVGNTNDNTFVELWNSERMRELRLNMLNDKPTSGCKKCYEHEANGKRSMRQDQNREAKHLMDRVKLTNDDGSLDEVYMSYMDIRFSNICNMKCRSCGPELSSFWVDDAIKMGRYTKDQPRILKIKKSLDELWNDMEQWISTVERIYFAGGEPLIMDEHYKILEHLISIGRTDIGLSYNTNLSKLTYKNKDVIELWKHFPVVRIGASLDASGERAEYMRSGTKWKDIEHNIQRIKTELPNAELQVSATISAYNALHITDFLDDWIEKGWIKPWDVDFNILLFPEYQRAQVLPEKIRHEIQRKTKRFIAKHDLSKTDKNGRAISGANALIESVETGKTHLLDMFIKYNNQLDMIRDEHLTNAFPELRAIYFK